MGARRWRRGSVTHARPVLLWLTLLGSLSTCSWASARSVLAIDYGVDSFKASLVQPGVPFDVLLNRDSKRKTHSIVTLRRDERYIGSDAATMSARFPLDTIPAVKLLLGPDAAQRALYSELYATRVDADEQGRHVLTLSSGTSYSVEEILAMQLSQAAAMAQTAGRKKVADVLLVVPAFFGQAERRAALDAVELAGLKPLGLLNDGAAVAVNYATARTFGTEPEYHLFYDAGAGSVRATLASFATKTVSDHPGLGMEKNVTQISILGVGYDRTAGGAALDAHLRTLLQTDFLEGAGQALQASWSDHERARGKLLKEANRVKHVLSANSLVQSRIEGLAGDIDFKTTVSRQQLEALAHETMPRLVRPITDALAMAHLSMEVVDSVVLVGGHTRVPLVQAAIRSVVPEAKVAQNLNADEAAVMGAALYGAALSRQFRTKDIRVADVSLADVSWSHNATSASADAGVTLPLLFPRGTQLGTSRVVNITAAANLLMTLYTSEAGQVASPLTDIVVYDVSTALANLTATEATDAIVQIQIDLGTDGVVRVRSARLVGPDAPSERSGGLLDGLLGGGRASEPPAAAPDAVASAASDPTSSGTKVSNSVSVLSFAETPRNGGPLSKGQKVDAKKRLRDMDQTETRKRAREEALNALEGHLYRLRDQLDEADLVHCSTEAERDHLANLAAEVSEWLATHAETAATKDLRQRRSDLEKTARPVLARMTEERDRPRAIDAFHAAVLRGQAWLSSVSAAAAPPAPASEADGSEAPRYSDDELAGLTKLLADEQSWLSALQPAQARLQPHEDALLRTSELERRASAIEAEVGKLARKPRPRRPTQPRSTSASPSGTSSMPSATAVSTGATAEVQAVGDAAGRPGDEL